jgi:hypothetical protein
MRTECTAVSLNCSNSTVLLFVSEVSHFCRLFKPSDFSFLSAIAHTDSGWQSLPVPCYCHSSHIRQQSVENPCGCPFASPSTDWSVPDRLFRWFRNSRLSTGRRNLLREYADEKSCPIVGTDTSNTKPIKPLRHYRYIGHRDKPETIISGLSDPCSALSSDHLTVLINTACFSPFQQPTDLRDFRRTDWANIHNHLEDLFPSIRSYTTGRQSTISFRTPAPF